MKALIYRQFGEPDVLEYGADWPRPGVADHGVLVRCAAGGVNPKDILLRQGKFSRTLARRPLPRGCGLDVAGEVVAVDDGVHGIRLGDQVFGMTHVFEGGTHAEFAALSADELALMPAGMQFAPAAAVPLAGLTALQALRDSAGLGAGQRVLINGASGGVGHFAVQIAKALGAETDAACSPHNAAFVTSLGADGVFDRTKTTAAAIGRRYDVVFDVFGNYSRRDFKRQLGRAGVYVTTVPRIATLAGEALARLGLDQRRRWVAVRSNRADLDQLKVWLEDGSIRPHVDAVYPITRAAEAHRHVETRRTVGKVVLSIDA